jgi:hypothetical protein
MFRWETLREVGTHDMLFESGMVRGKAFEVEMTNGEKVRVWRSADGQQYFCHGLTFGGVNCCTGAVSPYGDDVPKILDAHYVPVPESQARSGDVLVWRGGAANEVIHSAILAKAVLAPGKNYLDYSATLLTKNGILPPAVMTLGELIGRFYGESYNVFRNKQSESIGT